MDRPFSFLAIKVYLWLIYHECTYVAFMYGFCRTYLLLEYNLIIATINRKTGNNFWGRFFEPEKSYSRFSAEANYEMYL